MKMSIIFLIGCACMLQLSCEKGATESLQYRYSETIVIDGLKRTYTVQLPRNYYSDTSSKPMVIGLHGTGGSGSQFETDYGFSVNANAENYIAVYPDGVKKEAGRLKIRTWNAGACCDYAMHTNVNDVKFINTLIDELSARFQVNRKRVYIAGMSNGAMMAYRLAVELPQKIAAIASVSGSMVVEKNASQQGLVPVLHIHSVIDTKVPFNGGKGIQDYHFPPAMDGLHYWARRNGCDTVADLQQYNGYELHTWQSATGDALVQCYITQDGGHSWPGSEAQRRLGDPSSTAIDANDVIWKFFNHFTLP